MYMVTIISLMLDLYFFISWIEQRRMGKSEVLWAVLTKVHR